MVESGAPASSRSADTRRVRGVAFGCAKVCVSWTIPAIRSVASVSSMGTPSSGRSRATSSHVAAACGSTQIAAPKPGLLTWWSMFTMRARANQAASSVATAPMRLISPASRMTATSGSSCGARRTSSTPGMKARNGGVGSELTTSVSFPRRRPASAMARAAPSVSASGFSWQKVLIRLADRSASTTSRI